MGGLLICFPGLERRNPTKTSDYNNLVAATSSQSDFFPRIATPQFAKTKKIIGVAFQKMSDNIRIAIL